MKLLTLAKRNSRCGVHEKGQTIVEFALVIIAFFIILFGIFDFGIAAYTYHFVANAAQEGARWAMVHGSESPTPAAAQDVEDFIKDSRLPPAINPERLTVTTEWPGDVSIGSCPAASNKPGCPVKVTIQYNYNFLLPFMPDAGINMSRASQMRISY